MKLFLVTALFLVAGFAVAQKKNKPETPFTTIHRIFNSYISYPEATDTKEHKDSMIKALQTLQHPGVKDELYLLINVWMYYDPTDFPTRDLIDPIFFANKPATIEQVNIRIKNKLQSESKHTAPFADLYALKDTLSKSLEKR